MDGGVGREHMSETIKAKIKQNAILRRERRLLTRNDWDLIVATETDDASASAPRAISHASDPTVENSPPADQTALSRSPSPVRPSTLWSPVHRSEGSHTSVTPASSTSDPTTLPTRPSSDSFQPAGYSTPIRVELGSVMIYLDYVFPFLFPFYHPPLIETGRQWLLGLLCQNEVSFHLAASLSAYFFSLVPQNDEQALHDDCQALVRNRLLEQMDMAIGSIQSTVSAMSHHGPQSPLLDKTRIMEEITQLLIVEITVRREVEWSIHLTPALALFDEIFKDHGMDRSEPSLATLVSSLPVSFPVTIPHHKPLPNTADQSALVFFVSLLLFVDIVASTSLGTPPALQSYHRYILSSRAGGNCAVQLDAIVGCHNWALAAIGDVSALCAWKCDAKQTGNFSVIDLVDLAKPISQALEEGLRSLDNDAAIFQQRNGRTSWLQGYYSRHDRATEPTCIADVTRIWAYAAKIYLAVSLSGWQARSAEVQACVANVLRLLQTIESPAQLRSLSWPICVAGCLALPSQEHDFRSVVGIMGQLGEFGTIYTALRIMEAVWKARDTIDGSAWDVASCLSILGSSALLL